MSAGENDLPRCGGGHVMPRYDEFTCDGGHLHRRHTCHARLGRAVCEGTATIPEITEGCEDDDEGEDEQP